MNRQLLLIAVTLLLAGCAISPFEQASKTPEQPAAEEVLKPADTPEISDSESDITDPGFENAKKELDLVE